MTDAEHGRPPLLQAQKLLELLMRQVSRLVEKSADRIAGDDGMEALQAEVDLYRFLARNCERKIEMAKALGLA
jgi:hypothetical protein